MTHDELEELLGAYALDALDPEERQAVDEHLVSCPRCRAELAAHHDVAALLGNSVVDAPAGVPEDLWDRISSSLQDEPPVLARFARQSRRPRLALLLPIGAAAAAAVVLVVALLAVKVGNLDGQLGTLSHQTTVASVLLNPSHKTVELTSAVHASWRATVIYLPDGDGYLVNPSMPTVSSRQTFQLWALSSGKVVSLGVLGSHPSGAPLRVEPTMTVLMITAEPLGGTPVPTTPVLVRGNLPVT